MGKLPQAEVRRSRWEDMIYRFRSRWRNLELNLHGRAEMGAPPPKYDPEYAAIRDTK